MILWHERDPKGFKQALREYGPRFRQHPNAEAYYNSAAMFDRRVKAVALLAAAVFMLAVPPFLKPAAALMFDLDGHKIGWDDNGGNGGFRVCAWYGCISYTPATPQPLPYVPPYGHDQS